MVNATANISTRENSCAITVRCAGRTYKDILAHRERALVIIHSANYTGGIGCV